jgi:hypothetical protein
MLAWGKGGWSVHSRFTKRLKKKQPPATKLIVLPMLCSARPRLSDMSGKRKHAPLQAGSPPYPKRPRPEQPDMDGDEEDTPSVSTPRLPIPQSRTDPIFGQKHAFPGLDDPVDGDELLYGPPEDGIEYLRLVRLVFCRPPLCPFPIHQRLVGEAKASSTCCRCSYKLTCS